MPETGQRMAVVGAGVAGLATAFDLQLGARERGLALDLTVFEAAADVGGKLQSIRENGFLIEAGPNGWLDSEPATARLIDRLDLQEQLLRSEDATRHRFVYSQGRLRELPLTPPAFLKSDILPLSGKLRMAAELFVPARRDLGRAADDPASDETVFDFGRRRLGREFAETLLDPMVKGVFGGDARQLSLAAAFPRMVELERDHGGLLRAMIKLSRRRKRNGKGSGSAAGPAGTLHSFRDGMVVLPQRLRQALPAEFVTGQPVTHLRRDGHGWWVRTDDIEHGPYAVVVDAAPAHAAALHAPDAEMKRLLAAIPYAPMAVISLAFDRERVAHPLHGFGMLNPTREERRLLGVLWTSSIFRGRAPVGKVVLRCMAGGASQPEILKLSDDELVAACRNDLDLLYGLQGAPAAIWIVRHRRAIAQYTAGHLARLKALEVARQRWPGLYLTGSSYHGISVNHCIAEAERTATLIMDELVSRDAAAPLAARGHQLESLSRAATN